MNEYLSNKKLTINIRPVQFCYFYRKGNKGELKEILRYVSTQWGGIYNHIIPVLKSGKIYKIYQQIIQTASPDKFVSTLDKDLNDKLKYQLEKIFPSRNIGIGSFNYFVQKDLSASPLWFIAEDQLHRISLLCPKVSHVNDRMLTQLILFGDIDSKWLPEYKKVLAVHNFNNINTENHIINAQTWITPSSSPLNFTSINIKTFSVSGDVFANSSIIDVVIGDDESSLVYFWNLRALRERAQFNKTDKQGRRILLLPSKFLKSDILFEEFISSN